MRGIIVVNFKSYEEGTGKKGFDLARICEKAALEADVGVIVCPPLIHLGQFAEELSIPVYAQHVDAISEGSHTGYVTPMSVASGGGQGTLINHSERRMRIADIEKAIVECRRAEISTVVCTNSIGVSRACASLHPTYIAIEPPELIGGDVPVTKAKPEVVSGAVEAIQSVSREIGVLCGAGIKAGRDVQKAMELGSAGVLVASGIVKSKDPQKAMMDLVSGVP